MQKMNKNIFLFITLLFLIGCNNSNSQNDYSTPFLGGSEGIQIMYESGSPPDEVYDGGNYDFSIDLRVKNIGETDIPPGKLRVRFMGFLPSDFGMVSDRLEELQQINDILIERTEKDSDGNVIEGSEYNVALSALMYTGQLTGNMEFPIRADVCYEYTTTANSKLCYKKDFKNINDQKVCTPRGNKPVYNSGSPVHVTNLEQNVVGEFKTSFTFTIAKVGNGDIYDQLNDDLCGWKTSGSSELRKLQDQVYVIVNTEIPNAILSCPSLSETSSSEGGPLSGLVKLYSNERVVRCNVELPENQFDFEKVLNIQLKYNFEKSIERSVIAKHGI